MDKDDQEYKDYRNSDFNVSQTSRICQFEPIAREIKELLEYSEYLDEEEYYPFNFYLLETKDKNRIGWYNQFFVLTEEHLQYFENFIHNKIYRRYRFHYVNHQPNFGDRTDIIKEHCLVVY